MLSEMKEFGRATLYIDMGCSHADEKEKSSNIIRGARTRYSYRSDYERKFVDWKFNRWRIDTVIVATMYRGLTRALSNSI